LARIRQPIFPLNWNFLSLPRYCCGAGQKRASFIFNWTTFILFGKVIVVKLNSLSILV